MSEVVNEAVKVLSEKLSGGFSGGVAKFELAGEGAIMVDENGVRAGDEEADVTLTADAEVFQDILAGNVNPTGAFMTGKLAVSGDMGLAMKLGSAIG